MNQFDDILHEGHFNLKYDFGFILPALPLPTTSPLGFQALVNGLNKFKVVPSDVNIESPSSNLNDLALSIKIFNRLLLRLTHGTLEIGMIDFKFADFESEVIDLVLFVIGDCLASMSIEFGLSSAILNWNGHLQFDSDVSNTFVKNNIIVSKDPELPVSFVPNRVVYKLTFSDSLGIADSKLGIGESLYYKDALFTDFLVTYNTHGKPAGVAKRFYKHLGDVLKSVISVSTKSLDK